MKKEILFCIALSMTLLSCRKEPYIVSEEQDSVLPVSASFVRGFYLLNEGNMTTNKASLDYLNYNSGMYRRNIYGAANPDAVKGLGDVGNDLQIYGSKLYAVISCSDKVEIMDAKTAKRLKTITLESARYATFHNGKVYVSAYLNYGENGAGIVAEIDTLTLSITRRVTVGRQPEELCVVNNKLYVANSGGYRNPDYERIISVVDIESFSVIKTIDVGINLQHMKADGYGDLYVSSPGNYQDIPPALYVVDTQTETLKMTFDIGVNNICIMGDTAYIITGSYNYVGGQSEMDYIMLNVRTEILLPEKFINAAASEIRMPSCLAVCPETHNIYVCDALDYTTSGYLYCFDKNGRKQWKVKAGYIPSHISFY